MSTPPPAQGSAQRRSRQIAGLVALGAAAIAVVAMWTAAVNVERRAIQQLPEQERRALYGRTLHTLESSCRPQLKPKGLEDFCREQAEFIVQFPECDEACRSLAKRHQRAPSR